MMANNKIYNVVLGAACFSALTAIIPDKFNILSDKQLADITLNPQKYNHSGIYLEKMLLRGEILSGQ